VSFLIDFLIAFGVGFAVAEVSVAATSLYLHRCLAHRALTLRPEAALLLRTWLWLTTGIKANDWAAIHRRHHAACDTPDDPHSPAVLGFWRVQLTNVALYRKAARNRELVARYSRDLNSDWLDRHVFRHGGLGLGLGIALICLALGWPIGLLAAAIHTVLYIQINSSVNAVGHVYGRRPNQNSGTNGRLLALLSVGEGLHNNHHAAPTSARFSLRRGEIDLGWWCVATMRTLRLATVRHSEPKLRLTQTP